MSNLTQSNLYLVLRIPSSFYLEEKYELSESISLMPGSKYESHEGKRIIDYTCSFHYVEQNPPSEQIGPSTWPCVPSYKNLRSFVTFWTFLTHEPFAIRAFETSDDLRIVSEPPIEQSSCWGNNTERLLNAARFVVQEAFLSLDSAFETFQSADSLQNLAALLMYRPNSYVDGRRIFYKNYLLNASLIWFVIDALIPSESCTSQGPCPKCGKESHFFHPQIPFRSRAEKALSGFKHAIEYAELLDNLRKVRGKFVHNGILEKIPDTNYSDINSMTGIYEREVTINDLKEKIGSEGLNTESQLVTAHQIAYWLVFNKLFPTLNIWPEISQLKLWCGSI